MRLSKKAIIELIEKIPFDEISVPQWVANNDQHSTAIFFETIGLALVDVLISHSPPKTSPQKLFSLSAPFETLQQEQDTPTKPRVKETKQTPSAPTFQTIHSNRVGIPQTEGRDVSKFRILPSIDSQRRQALQAMVDDSERNSTFKRTLTPLDPIAPPPRSLTPLQMAWDHPRPDFHNIPPYVEDKRQQALEKLDLAKDPYITRLERKADSRHPYVLIRGEIQAPRDDEGNLMGGFVKECNDADGLALVDTGAECCVVCAEFLGLEFNERRRAFFNFEYILRLFHC